MLGRIISIIFLVIVAICIGAYFAFTHFDISALSAPPGRVEAFLAAQAKHRLVARAAEQTLPAEPQDTKDNQSDGHMLYGSLCAGCHGYDDRTPTPLGKSFNPPSPSLASGDVQQYTNAELFVIIHGGLRFSGMPGFGNAHSNDEIWSLVHYVRSLPSAPAHH
ncbi:MAG TPA: c-type cytochrome [Candidatus Acidoferrales bacterium]|jgi:mono/diheme cytochrome c family protein|nr:c-type cytochrome [Candidatus Acidoferrales bacterium]